MTDMPLLRLICMICCLAATSCLPVLSCAPRSSAKSTSKLTLDPTHNVPLVGWWYNGTETLHLQEDLEYHLFADTNRYARPLSHGQWAQKTYATLFLSPYNTPTTMRQRVTLARDGEHVTLKIPGYAPFLRMDPLHTSMQRLVTTWISQDGLLDLRADQRYVYQPIPTSHQVMNMGHRGVWTLKGNVVTLFPDPSGVKQVSFEVRHQTEADKTTELWSRNVIYRPVSE